MVKKIDMLNVCELEKLIMEKRDICASAITLVGWSWYKREQTLPNTFHKSYDSVELLLPLSSKHPYRVWFQLKFGVFKLEYISVAVK